MLCTKQRSNRNEGKSERGGRFLSVQEQYVHSPYTPLYFFLFPWQLFSVFFHISPWRANGLLGQRFRLEIYETRFTYSAASKKIKEFFSHISIRRNKCFLYVQILIEDRPQFLEPSRSLITLVRIFHRNVLTSSYLVLFLSLFFSSLRKILEPISDALRKDK